MSLVLEEVRTANRYEEANARLERLINLYGSKEHAAQLVQEGCALIRSYVPCSELKRCEEIEGLMHKVLTIKKPSVYFCKDIDDKVGKLRGGLSQVCPIVGDMYTELYQKVCGLVFSKYAEEVKKEIEGTPTFKERVKSEEEKRAAKSHWNAPSLSFSSADFGAEGGYNKPKKKKKRK